MDVDMEPGILQARNIASQHHGHDHLYSSISDRVDKLFGRFREEFQGDLSAQNLDLKIDYYGTFLPTQLMASPSSNSANEKSNSAEMEARIENLFGHFRQNFHEDNMGAQFCDYGTFLSAQLSESQASSNPVVPIRTKKYVTLNDILKTRLTNKTRVIRNKRPRTSGCFDTLDKTSILLTEARSFKHRADRLKKEGQETLGNKLYLEAVLKFLQVASFWEHNKQGNRKHDAIRLLLETAEFSKRCASECRDMQATILLYEAMELASKRAKLLEGHPEMDGANHRCEIHEFIIRARQARFM